MIVMEKGLKMNGINREGSADQYNLTDKGLELKLPEDY